MSHIYPAAPAALRMASLNTAALRMASLNTAALRMASLNTADLRMASANTADLRMASANTADLRMASANTADLRMASANTADLRMASANTEGAKLLPADVKRANKSLLFGPALFTLKGPFCPSEWISQEGQGRYYDEERPEVPMLFRDVPSLLIIFVLTMPQPLRKEHFMCVVKVLYTLQYTQALAALSIKFSPEERQAWSTSGALKKSMPNATKSWEALLSHVISELSNAKCIYDYPSEEASMLCSSVWSPQSIEFFLQQCCLPYLRLSSLLQHHLYGDTLTGCQVEEEFSMLAVSLGLLAPAPASAAGNPVSSAACLEWAVSPFSLLPQWCAEVTSLPETQAEQTVTLLVQDPRWAAPRLLQLPENYNSIFQHYHRKACTSCSKVPKDPALCLVCGAFVCLKGLCCKQQGICECVLHSQHCGAATGIFLLINASVIIIIRGHRFCLWGSVYLDAHGEEDRDLRRGKPLFLCAERYQVLEQQWVAHTFDHINKRWGPHYNGL
ncbi:hypothetical protein ACEWY4_022824 [Coilia grayii]|uniref:E3 ubiquitin-protein ligase n=1 Tax=Coilia grayii TaxID=363190 RepID=A0ABD1J2W8_9TELE